MRTSWAKVSERLPHLFRAPLNLIANLWSAFQGLSLGSRALGEFLSTQRRHQGMVDDLNVRESIPGKERAQMPLSLRTCEQILASKDAGDAHEIVIDDVGQVVGRDALTPPHHDVVSLGGDAQGSDSGDEFQSRACARTARTSMLRPIRSGACADIGAAIDQLIPGSDVIIEVVALPPHVTIDRHVQPLHEMEDVRDVFGSSAVGIEIIDP